MKFICSDCKKEFKPDGDVYYLPANLMNGQKEPQWICPKCHKKWLDGWKVVRTVVNPPKYKNTHCTATCTLKNGKTFFFDPVRDYFNEDIPVDAMETARKAINDYIMESRKHEVDIAITDSFDEQSITGKDGTGNTIKVKFRHDRNGKLQIDDKALIGKDENFVNLFIKKIKEVF